MARDKAYTSLITNDHRKWKLPSYANNIDNISADKEEVYVIKWMKLTSNPATGNGPGEQIINTIYWPCKSKPNIQNLKQVIIS